MCKIIISSVKLTSLSYKLWYNYLKLRRRQVKGKCITDIAFEEVNNAFERALVFMHKVSNFLLTAYTNTSAILFVDASNLARLLPVSHGAVQDHSDTPHF